jgi:uncharacterized SAM-binding protein YcdF (DUF218 family)
VRSKRAWQWWIAALLCLAFVTYAFLGLGKFMAHEDALAPADAIFVFSGTRFERPLEALALYEAGYAPRIVLTHAELEPQALSVVERRGLKVPSDSDQLRDILVGLGVPPDAIITPARNHDHTGEEAATLRELALQRHWKRVIVVSSKYHLRRVALACGRALRGTDVRVMARGSRYEASTPERWWTRRADVRWLVSETPKYLAYAVGFDD